MKGEGRWGGGRPTGIIFCAEAVEDDEADYAHYTDTDQILVSRGILFIYSCCIKKMRGVGGLKRERDRRTK